MKQIIVSISFHLRPYRLGSERWHVYSWRIFWFSSQCPCSGSRPFFIRVPGDPMLSLDLQLPSTALTKFRVWCDVDLTANSFRGTDFMSVVVFVLFDLQLKKNTSLWVKLIHVIQSITSNTILKCISTDLNLVYCALKLQYFVTFGNTL